MAGLREGAVVVTLTVLDVIPGHNVPRQFRRIIFLTSQLSCIIIYTISLAQ